jgi:hypothetical protein
MQIQIQKSRTNSAALYDTNTTSEYLYLELRICIEKMRMRIQKKTPMRMRIHAPIELWRA